MDSGACFQNTSPSYSFAEDPKERANSISVDSAGSNRTCLTTSTYSTMLTHSSNQTVVSHSHMMVDGESTDSGLSTSEDASDYLDDDLDEHVGPIHAHSLPQHDQHKSRNTHSSPFQSSGTSTTRQLAMAASPQFLPPQPCIIPPVGAVGVPPRQSDFVAFPAQPPHQHQPQPPTFPHPPHHPQPQPFFRHRQPTQQSRTRRRPVAKTLSSQFNETILLPADMGIDPCSLPVAPDEAASCHTPELCDVEPTWDYSGKPIVANDGPNHVVRMRIPPVHEHDPRSAVVNQSESSSSSLSSDSPPTRKSFWGGIISRRKEMPTPQNPVTTPHRTTSTSQRRSHKRTKRANDSSHVEQDRTTSFSHSSKHSSKSHTSTSSSHHKSSRHSHHYARHQAHASKKPSGSSSKRHHQTRGKTSPAPLPDMSPLFELFGIDPVATSSKRSTKKRSRAAKSDKSKHRRGKRDNHDESTSSERARPRKKSKRRIQKVNTAGMEELKRSMSPESLFLPIDVRTVDGTLPHSRHRYPSDDIMSELDLNRSNSDRTSRKSKKKKLKKSKSSSKPPLSDFDADIFDGPGPSLDIRGMIDFYHGQMEGGTPATYPPPHGPFAASLVPTLPPATRIPMAPSNVHPTMMDEDVKWAMSSPSTQYTNSPLPSIPPSVSMDNENHHVSPDLSARFAVPGHGSPFTVSPGGSEQMPGNEQNPLRRRVATVPANLNDMVGNADMEFLQRLREEKLNRMFSKRPQPRKNLSMETRLRNWRDVTRRVVEETVCYDLVPESCKITVLHSQLPLHAAFAALVEQNVTCAPVWEPKSNRFLGSVTLVNFAEMLVSYHNKTQKFLLPEEEMVQKVADWSFFTSEEYKHRVAPVVSPEDNVLRMLSLLDSFSEQHVGVVQSSRNIICIADYLTVLHHVLPSWGQCGTWIDVPVQAVGWISATNSSCSSSTPLVWALQSLCESRHRAVVIVDEKKQLLDMLTVNDLKLLSMNFEISVGDFLGAHASDHRFVKCRPNESCLDVLENMLQYCTDTAVVLDGNDVVLGLLTISHVFSVLLESSDFRLKEMRSNLSLMTRTSASSQLYTLRNCTVSTGSSMKALESSSSAITNTTTTATTAPTNSTVPTSLSDVHKSSRNGSSKSSLLSRQLAVERGKQFGHFISSNLSLKTEHGNQLNRESNISPMNRQYERQINNHSEDTKENVRSQPMRRTSITQNNNNGMREEESSSSSSSREFTAVPSKDLGKSSCIDPHIPMYTPHGQDLSQLAASSQKWYIPQDAKNDTAVGSGNIIPQYMS